MDEMFIDYHFAAKGFVIKIKYNDKVNKFSVTYPKEIWQKFPKKFRKQIIENFVYLSTSAVPTMVGINNVYYDMNSPLLGSFFMKPFMYYMPLFSDEYNSDLNHLIKRYMNLKYNFKSYNVKLSGYEPELKERSVNLFTFGKDSLLSYAIGEEIGLSPIPVYIEEPDILFDENHKRRKMYENKHKDVLAKKFKQEFRKDTYKIKDELGLIRESGFFNVTDVDVGSSSDLTEFALLSIPYNNYFKAKYIVYGNEQSCGNSYVNKDGFNTYPVFDQTHEWNLEISKILNLLTKKMQAVSLIEPIHELFITRILHYRYPQYAKYQMSCFAQNKSAINSRWCHQCSKCARMYIFLKANGIDPKVVEYKENMLTKDKIEFYPLFGKSKDMKPYDFSGLGRDEQLYAFYLAYKNGAKGYLINLFKKKFLKEAIEREKELFNTYFKIYDSVTMPHKILKKVLKIYNEELEKVPKPE
ncbi:MAG: hypothetical protein V1859_09145 [archaeon]